MRISIAYLLTAAIALLLSFTANAQAESENDTVKEFPVVEPDTALFKIGDVQGVDPQPAPPDTGHSPGLATWMSVALPGLGQVYNGKWWKVPIIYAGLGATAYYFIENTRELNYWSDIISDRYDPNVTDPYDGIYSNSQLFTIQNSFRRYRDLSIIVGVVIYGLQILDANVDAHLYYFDVSQDLAINWQPTIQNSHLGAVYGARVVFSLK